MSGAPTRLNSSLPVLDRGAWWSSAALPYSPIRPSSTIIPVLPAREAQNSSGRGSAGETPKCEGTLADTLHCLMNSPKRGLCRFLECGPTFARTGQVLLKSPKFGRKQVESGRTGADTGRCWAKCAQIWGKLSKHWPTWPGIDQIQVELLLLLLSASLEP